MTTGVHWRRILFGSLGLAALVAAVCLLARAPESVSAATKDPNVCRVTLALDRSGSIGALRMDTLRNEIRNLFFPWGVYDPKVELAFWSFSDGPPPDWVYPPPPNWDDDNAPFHDFVSSRGLSSSFESALARLSSEGATNYQQGFGYRSNSTPNPTLRNIVSRTDVIVFITDGFPNKPTGNGSDFNQQDADLGRQAAQKHKDAGIILVGGFVDGPEAAQGLGTLRYVINGDRNNSTDVFTIRESLSNLSTNIERVVDEKCRMLLPPPSQPYNNNASVSGPEYAEAGDTVTMTANVANGGETASPAAKLIVQQSSGPGMQNQSTSPSSPNNGHGYVTTGCRQGSGPLRNPCYYWQYNSINGGANYSGQFRFTIPPNVPAGSRICFRPFAQPASPSSLEATGTETCVTVVAKPYLQVFSGDISAGNNFKVENDASCRIFGAGEIKAFNRGGSNGYAGAGGQLGVFASGAITDFISASFRSSAPVKPTGLAFANTGGSIGPWGGSFGSAPQCVENYWTNAYNIQPGYTTGSRIIPTHPNPGSRQVIYVDGDATINGSIVYANDANWNLDNIPSFWLIVKGNIRISNDVTRLDGVYVALPKADGSGGTIYTCFQGTTSVAMASGCGNQLTIYGAFIAKQVKLLRTPNSLINSVPGETYASTRAAERFIYSPETWLVTPDLTSSSHLEYDSITSLPPVL